MSRVSGKVVLVSGAGSGIGRATATLLAKEGATVIVTDINRPGGLETVQQIGGKNNGGGARFESTTLQGNRLEAHHRRHPGARRRGLQLRCAGDHQSGGGSIMNTSSLAAFGYGASKGAVRQFTKKVAIHCARKGDKVRCNSVHPGIILTPMGNSVMPSDKARERARRRIPIGEFGAPEDIAYGILYLISDESRFVTGTRLVIDGGMNAI